MSAGRRLVAGLALLALVALAALQAVPPLSGRVVDLTGTLTAAEIAALDQRLADLERRKGSQLAVLMVPSTQPEAIEQFSMRVVEAWRLGRNQPDDGILLLIARDDRAVRIEVGYGLEGAIPDATAKRIIDEYLLPAFRAGDFAGGISAAVDRLIGLVDGEPLPAPVPSLVDSSENLLPLVFMLALVAGGILRRLLGPLPGAGVTALLAGGVAWLLAGTVAVALFMALVGFVIGLLGSGPGGRWVSHPRGWPGGGGGGFRGGGGGFGGGGASGRW